MPDPIEFLDPLRRIEVAPYSRQRAGIRRSLVGANRFQISIFREVARHVVAILDHRDPNERVDLVHDHA